MFGAIWMYKLYNVYTNKSTEKVKAATKSKQTSNQKPKNKNIDNDYSDILNSDKYRVKGKFES